MISLFVSFLTLLILGVVGLLLMPFLFVGWHLLRFVIKVTLFFGIVGIGLSMLRFL